MSAPDFREGLQTQIALEKRHLLSALTLRARYDVVTTGGSGAGAPLPDAAYRIPDEIRVMMRGRAVHNVKGHTLGVIADLWLPEPPAQTDPTDDTAGTESDREATIILPFFMPHSKTPDSFIFPAAAPGAEPQLQISHANAAALFDTDVDGAFEFDNAQWDLYEHPLYGESPEPWSRWGVTSIRHTSFAVTQNGSKSVDLSHLSNGEHVRAVIVEAFAGGSSGIGYEYSDDVVTEVGPLEISGREEFEEVPFAVLQNRNKVEYARESRKTGVVVIDAAEDRRTGPGELWGVRGGVKPTLDLAYEKQSGDNLIVVTTISTVPGSGANGARSTAPRRTARRRR